MTPAEIKRLHKVARGVVANAGRLSTKRKPRRSHVMDATGLGSTSALGLCLDYGFDPDEEVGTDRMVSTDGECDQCVEYEAAIEESLPEYVLDDGTDEPANYLERIEYAGGDAKRWLRVKNGLRAVKVDRDSIDNAGRLSLHAKPRWVHVHEETGIGAVAAVQMCREYGLDPDELVGK